MAVQQNKKTPSKRGMRRSHDALSGPTLSIDQNTGETHLRHNVSPEGYYKGRKVIEEEFKDRQETALQEVERLGELQSRGDDRIPEDGRLRARVHHRQHARPDPTNAAARADGELLPSDDSQPDLGLLSRRPGRRRLRGRDDRG